MRPRGHELIRDRGSAQVTYRGSVQTRGIRRIVASALTALLTSLFPSATQAATDVSRYAGQQLAWQPCGSMECAWLTVPMSYDDPSLGDIRLAVSRIQSRTADRLGSIVVNPGGPGAAGVAFTGYVARDVMPTVARRYDVVGFDPRGVGESAPVSCLSGRQTAAWLDADPTPDSPAEIRALMRVAGRVSPGCLRSNAVLASHVGTDLTVQDLELLRSALGDERLNFLGFSYGTVIGAQYMQRFPDRVGRVVLDGAVDPTLDGMQLSQGQSAGFQQAVWRFAAYCARQSRCPARSHSGVISWLNRLFTRLDARPMATQSTQPLVEAQAITAVFYAMYDPSMWPLLVDALSLAQRGDGDNLQEIAYSATDRTGRFTFATNTNSAFYAISCWDSPATPAARGLAAAGRQWSKTARVPALAQAMAWGNAPCSTWFGHTPQPPGPVTSATASPVVVIGTTRDPATPYRWSQALASQLPTATLLTYDGDGHTAYGTDSACIQGAVDNYFLTGVPPASGLRCR